MHYDSKATGRRIRNLRIEANMTIEQMSIRLNITDRHCRRIERGENIGSIDLLIEISCIFEVSLDYLILVRLINNVDIKNILERVINYLIEFEKNL